MKGEDQQNYLGDMSFYQASIILSIMTDALKLSYPDDFYILEIMNGSIVRFLKDGKLTDAEIFKELEQLNTGFQKYSANDGNGRLFFDYMLHSNFHSSILKIANHFNIPIADGEV